MHVKSDFEGEGGPKLRRELLSGTSSITTAGKGTELSSLWTTLYFLCTDFTSHAGCQRIASAAVTTHESLWDWPSFRKRPRSSMDSYAAKKLIWLLSYMNWKELEMKEQRSNISFFLVLIPYLTLILLFHQEELLIWNGFLGGIWIAVVLGWSSRWKINRRKG